MRPGEAPRNMSDFTLMDEALKWSPGFPFTYAYAMWCATRIEPIEDEV